MGKEGVSKSEESGENEGVSERGKLGREGVSKWG